jgi:poly(3-hydroxybutyrate) depolymerase
MPLYQLHAWQKQMAQPLRIVSETLHNMYTHPMNPLSYTRAGRAMAASLEMLERMTRHFAKPAFNLPFTTIDGEQVEITEEIVEKRTFCQLRHFKRGVERDDPKVLLVAPMSGHFATLLRGTVQALLPAHDVYITDWRDARQVPLSEGSFDLDDYMEYIIDYIHALGPDVHVIAVCQPSVPVMGAASLMAAANDPMQARSFTFMGGPIDTRINPTTPNDYAMKRTLPWFERSVISRVPAGFPGYMRRVYPGFVQLAGFMSMNLDRHVGAHIGMFNHLIKGDDDSADSHRRFYDEYLAVMDLTAEFYLQTIQVVFQEHHLPRGIWTSRGRKIQPELITRPALMTVEGELDDISGVGQTKAAHTLTPGIPESRKVHYEQPGVGHYGIFNGRKWREQIMPKVAQFIRDSAVAQPTPLRVVAPSEPATYGEAAAS